MAGGMENIPCRECAASVDARLAVCPHCGARSPGEAEWAGEGFEWKSSWLWMGSPVVHVAFGNGRDGRPRTARGVVAIGQRAVGGVAIGILSVGFVSIGIISVGIFSLGVVSVAALAAVGVNALAPLAIGVVAIGYKVGGVAVVGWKVMFAVTK